MITTTLHRILMFHSTTAYYKTLSDRNVKLKHLDEVISKKEGGRKRGNVEF